MLSNISHDIKTPMTVVLGYLEIIRLQGDASGEMVKKAEQKAQDVIELINQFFTLAKLEAGDMEIELTRLDICAICRETVLSFYEILTEKDFQVDIHIPKHGVYVWGDREALQRILNNLISNAVKYGAEGKFLGIALREEQEMVLVDVTDKGRELTKNLRKMCLSACSPWTIPAADRCRGMAWAYHCQKPGAANARGYPAGKHSI